MGDWRLAPQESVSKPHDYPESTRYGEAESSTDYWPPKVGTSKDVIGGCYVDMSFSVPRLPFPRGLIPS